MTKRLKSIVESMSFDRSNRLILEDESSDEVVDEIDNGDNKKDWYEDPDNLSEIEKYCYLNDADATNILDNSNMMITTKNNDLVSVDLTQYDSINEFYDYLEELFKYSDNEGAE